MKGPYQLLGECINNIITSFLGLVMFCFGLYLIFAKNEKVKNKKRGIFLVIAGFIVFAYNFTNVIIYFFQN
ncbi:MAG: hypothetical protein PUC37_04455 [Spirochaetales bacterium]|nr:hypothetical protein [Spirochaetales bacterium]